MSIYLIDQYEDDFERYDRASILQQPNIVKPLHGVNPRTIMGAKNWKTWREHQFVNAEFKYFITGDMIKSKRDAHLHECYSVDTTNHITECTGYVLLHPYEHAFIHSGRSTTLLKSGSPEMLAARFIKIVNTGLDLLENATLVRRHPDNGKILVYKSLFEARKYLDASTRNRLEKSFTPFDLVGNKVSELKKTWADWRLVYGGLAIGSNFSSYDAWYKHYKQLNQMKKGGVDKHSDSSPNSFDSKFEYIFGNE